MKVDSEKFEKHVFRIHELIEQSGSVVTWNDHLPDPDNPDQFRQIDITIKRGKTLTLIECRIHKKPQDVKWIEELIGKRISLHADAVIAVSASGFTVGAIKKAESHGIILRDFQTLTEEEVKAWGYKTRVYVTYLQYQNVSLDFGLRPKYQHNFVPEIFKKEVISYKNLIYLLFEEVAKEIDKNENTRLAKSGTVVVKFKYPREPIVAGFVIAEVIFRGHFRKIEQEINIPAVFIYDDPKKRKLNRDVLVEKVELGDSEIMQSKDRVSIRLDFSSIKPPHNSQFYTVTLDFNRLVTMTDFQALGLQKPPIILDKIRFLAHF